MRTCRGTAGGFAWLTCILLAACGAKPAKPPEPPEPPKPQPVALTIVVSADVNPDGQGRPSPIVVRLYQLKDEAAFKATDFYALYEKDQATLGAALVSREDFEFAPGERHSADMPLSTEAQFIGVLAAYRDIRNAQWRTLTAAPEKGIVNNVKKNKLAIAVERARVSFVPPD
jgi:type VI secretion system protein VasD